MVLGRVVEGMEVIDRVEAETSTASEEKPLKRVAAGPFTLFHHVLRWF